MPNLFGRNTPKKTEPGLVSQWDVVAFDEVAGLDRISDPQALQIFKDYMESGAYSRGKEPITAHASMVFEGNLDLDVQIAAPDLAPVLPVPVPRRQRPGVPRSIPLLPARLGNAPDADLDVRGFLRIHRRLPGRGLAGTAGRVARHRDRSARSPWERRWTNGTTRPSAGPSRA